MPSIKITESGKSGRVPKEAQFVIATSPPVPRGGLNGNQSARKSKGNGKSNGNGKGKGRGANGRRQRGRRSGNGNGHNKLACLNAFGKHSLGLPRAVGDYTFVTTIDNIPMTGSGARQLFVFAPWTIWNSSQERNMINFIGYTSNNGIGIGQNPTAGIEAIRSGSAGDIMLGGTECVPASMSVRVTCPTAMQTATGQFFLGKWNMAADPREYATYNDLADGFISFGQPRPLTAARLAMRGVQCNSMPRNMSEYAQFRHVSFAAGGTGIFPIAPFPTTVSEGFWGGLAPIFLVVEPSVTAGTDLNIQVAIRWRYRFPAVNPAAKTHTYQPITSDSVWNDTCRAASAIGHAVESIPEAVEALF